MTGLDELEAFLFDKPGSNREQPFGPEVLVFKVGGKIFALIIIMCFQEVSQNYHKQPG